MNGELELLPNTRQVRDFYCHARQAATQRWRDHSFEAEFDAWLTAHDAEVAAEAWDRNSEETEFGGVCSCCGIGEIHRPQNPYRKGDSDDQPA